MSRSLRRTAVLALADEVGRRAVLLRSFADVAWYSGGLDARVDRSGEGAAIALLISAEGEWLVADEIEGPRLEAEGRIPEGIELVTHPWTGSPDAMVAELAGGVAVVAADLDVAPLRRVLDDEAVAQYRVLGSDTVAVLDEVEPSLHPEMTELEAAALLAAAGWRKGAHLPVLLVAGADRIPRFRHPLPTRAALGERAMLVTCLERGGLFASLTRYVHFAPPPAELTRRLAITDDLLRRLREEATVPGKTMGEAFAECRRFYADAGFPDEWQRHHQGGIAGYRSREVIARPGEQTVIEAGMAFAWNPSITGAKSEETFVLEIGGSTEVLT